jgi:hypothetical protein
VNFDAAASSLLDFVFLSIFLISKWVQSRGCCTVVYKKKQDYIQCSPIITPISQDQGAVQIAVGFDPL